MLTTIASYRLLSGDLERSLENTRNEPFVNRETEYYLENIENVKSIDEFVDNDRLFNYAMKALGLEEMSYAKAFMRKALEGGIDDPQSFANSFQDPRYQEFVATFNFVRHGENTTIFERTRSGVADQYVRQTLEENAGADNQGVRLALYFQRKAPEVTSVYGLMGDRALLEVTQTALNLSSNTSSLDIDRQAELIARELDIEDLKDPEKLDAFIERFTAIWEVSNPSSVSSNTAVPNIILSQPTIVGIGDGILASLQNLKIGG
ncbi:MAG: DUF1217 domain-containing protein [Filomicrobium sp.]